MVEITVRGRLQTFCVELNSLFWELIPRFRKFSSKQMSKRFNIFLLEFAFPKSCSQFFRKCQFFFLFFITSDTAYSENRERHPFGGTDGSLRVGAENIRLARTSLLCRKIIFRCFWYYQNITRTLTYTEGYIKHPVKMLFTQFSQI